MDMQTKGMKTLKGAQISNCLVLLFIVLPDSKEQP
jgi:hypothetical protein